MVKKTKTNSFADVDRAEDPDYFVNCLHEQYTKNSTLLRNKQLTLALADVQTRHFVLDVGCGTGVDAIQMAVQVGQSGHVYGIDFSHAMVTTANKNARVLNLPVTFQQNDIYALDFADNFFDRCRADKTFQHLSDPDAALKELIRVTKPGGKIIIADPDHDSLIIDTPFEDVNHRFVRFRSDQMPQGGIAHQLYGKFKEFGLVDVHVEPIMQVFTNYEEKKVSSPYLEEIYFAQKAGVVSETEADQWANYLQNAIANDRFLCLQTYIITVGCKPA
ncbi:methyltransferase domain-containing protein [Candidatus Leptofilum sp.]|uniref:methyltransferase domain-containing protein n=1 Tax=Candidatus Leptofilum sp. TaxID=3241576 RepID=UPI003B5C3AA3